MRYKLTRNVLGFTDAIELQHDEYESLLAATQRLIVLLGIEEKFDLLL